MKKSKLMFVLPMVCLLTLTSCGAETYTEVTDADKKETTLNAAKTANTEVNFTSGLVESEVKYVSTSKTVTASSKYGVKFEDGKACNYVELKIDGDNYVKMYTAYSKTDNKIMTAYDASSKSSSTTSTCKGKLAATLLAEVNNSSDDTSDASKQEDEVKDCLSVPEITVTTASTGFKIYTGSAGSTKVEYAAGTGTDTINYSMVISSKGYITSVASSGTSDGTTASGNINFSYNVSIPTLNFDSYSDGKATDAVNLLLIAENFLEVIVGK